MFQDTTRLRLMARPSLKDALQSFSTSPGSKLGRVGVSQSFRERQPGPPARPREPPPPPPAACHQPGSGPQSYSLAKKFFSFNKTEIKRINKFLGIAGAGEAEQRSQQDSNIYDIAESEENTSELGAGRVVSNATFYTAAGSRPGRTAAPRPKSNEFWPGRPGDPVKPPRTRRERSQSFTPRSQTAKAKIFNRSLSHITASEVEQGRRPQHQTAAAEPTEPSKRALSSSDLVHIFQDEERRSFKDIRKILSSPSISASSPGVANQIYRPKSQLSNSSSVINNSIKEEQAVLPATKDLFFDHIYEEIHDKVGRTSLWQEGGRPAHQTQTFDPAVPIQPPHSASLILV